MRVYIDTLFKVIFIILIILTFFYVFNNQYSFAGDLDPYNYSDPGSSGKEDGLKDMGNKIIGAVQVIGSLVSVLAIIIIGIKYMLGSVEEKAKYKETLWPYLLGAVMVFGIISILNVVSVISQSLSE